DHEEAARGASGQGQGQRRVLGRADPARPHALRDGRREPGDRARGVSPGRREASDSNSRRRAAGFVMKTRELRDMTEENLAEELLKLRREQFNLRIQSQTGQGAKPDQHGKVRKDIARIKTVLAERARQKGDSA